MPADGHAAVAVWQTAGFGIYVHWPFCAAKCPYCDFNSHVSAHIDNQAWAEAYEADLDRWATITEGRTVRSVFFGGGTPSLMDPATVARVLDRIARHWHLANDVEITLEANPTSSEQVRFAGFRSAGINRISLGVQALNDEDLQRLGRLHSAAEALAAVEIARAEFDRVSFDLIYARQNQTEAQWRAELTTALSLGMDHLSLYQLTIEPGTPFHARQSRGKLQGLPAEDRAVALYELTQDLCTKAGLPAYEVSNHARPGSESRHNLIYWRGGDWLGIGPGAHGRIDRPDGRTSTAAIRSPDAWLRALKDDKHAYEEFTVASKQDQAEEYLMMSLRLTEGSELSRLTKLGFAVPKDHLDELVDDGLLDIRAGRLRTTDRGRLLLNAVLAKLLSG